jgi:hypothetical protein
MKARLTALALVMMVFPLGVVLAHDEDLDLDNLQPRIGQISNEVAIQRLRTAGVENPQIVWRAGSQIIVEGIFEGRSATLRMDALQGHVTDEGDPARVIIGPGVAVEQPMITGPQLYQERSILSAPALMLDAVQDLR